MWKKENSFKINYNSTWENCDWRCEIIEISENEFIGKLWVFDEHDDYLVQWKVYKTSPIFNTKKKLSTYILNHWEKGLSHKK